MNEIPSINGELRKALAAEAKELLQNRVFVGAIKQLRAQWLGELMTRGSKDERDELVFYLRALNAIPMRIEGFVIDQLMADKKGRQ